MEGTGGKAGREGRMKTNYKVLCRLGAAKVYIVYTHTVDLCGKVVLCDFFLQKRNILGDKL